MSKKIIILLLILFCPVIAITPKRTSAQYRQSFDRSSMERERLSRIQYENDDKSKCMTDIKEALEVTKDIAGIFIKLIAPLIAGIFRR